MANSRDNSFLLGEGGGNLGARVERYQQLEKGSQIEAGIDRKRNEAQSTPEGVETPEMMDQAQQRMQQISEMQRYIEGAGEIQEKWRQKISLAQRLARFKSAMIAQQVSVEGKAQERVELETQFEERLKKLTEKTATEKAIIFISAFLDIACPIIAFTVIGAPIADAISVIGVALIGFLRVINKPKKTKLSFEAHLKMLILQAILEFVSAGVLPATSFVNAYVIPRLEKKIAKKIVDAEREDALKRTTA